MRTLPGLRFAHFWITRGSTRDRSTPRGGMKLVCNPGGRRRQDDIMDRDWNAIVEDLGPRLFRYFRARFSHEHSADLAQETLIRLVQKTRGGEFDPGRGSLRMYAYGIAHFVALEARKIPELKIQEVTESGDHLEQSLIDRDGAERMRRALRRLDSVQVQVISLMIDEEMTLTDIGVLLEMPVGTVKSHVHRAKQRLREILLAKESV